MQGHKQLCHSSCHYHPGVFGKTRCTSLAPDKGVASRYHAAGQGCLLRAQHSFNNGTLFRFWQGW